jgi:hypothetical protein
MRRTLFVSPYGKKWKVHFKNSKKGQVYENKEQAVIRARIRAYCYAPGYVTSIIIRSRSGRFQQEWTYGNDPFPPYG